MVGALLALNQKEKNSKITQGALPLKALEAKKEEGKAVESVPPTGDSSNAIAPNKTK